MHVQVQCPSGEAKLWLEPVVSLAHNAGLGNSYRQIWRVELPSAHHLYWPDLDIDLAIAWSDC